MGKMRFGKISGIFLFGLFLTGASIALSSTSSYAQGGGADQLGCQVIGGSLFPSAPNWVSQFSDARRQNVRRHTGLDLGYNVNHTVPQPPGCEILLNSAGGYRFNNKLEPIDNASKQIIGSDKGGYGYQLFYKCGEYDGEQITLRYAHVPQNPITSSGQILQGCSGSSGCGGESHYHFEVVIGNRPVDPECTLWGEKPAFGKTNYCNKGGGDCAKPECRVCPTSLPAGPQNLCDSNVRRTLIQHGQTCTSTPKYPDGQTRTVPGGKSIDPSRLGPTNGQPDPGSATGHDYDGDDTHDGSPDDGAAAGNDGGFTGDVDEIYPPTEEDGEKTPLPPVNPPTPATPGGDPDLVPKPTEGQEPQELSGCATDTWTAMVNQAVMETRREDLLNKRFIIKPDSVLQYSCFDKTIAKAKSTSSIFSGTQSRWVNEEVDLIGKKVTVKIYEKDQVPGVEQPYRINLLQPNTLEESLSLVVDESFSSYINNQFNHPVLAGTTEMNNQGDLCVDMSQIWKAAKCKHFDGTEVFYTFEDLTTTDPREFPPNMKCGE